MTDAPGRYEFLDFNAPMSGSRADALAAALATQRPETVLDVGCGWGEILLRVLAVTEGGIGRGVDLDEALIARGRRNAAQRGLAERAQLIVGDASQRLDPADAVICIGADHALGSQLEALSALRALVRSGGRLLFGTGFWQRAPSGEQAAVLDMKPEDLPDLATLVDFAVAARFRPLDVQTANEDEWNAFESGYLADWEEWLVRNLGHADAPGVREMADQHRAGWLRGYRGVLGFAYLTLAPI